MSQGKRKLLVVVLFAAWLALGVVWFFLYLSAGDAQVYPRRIEQTPLMHAIIFLGVASLVAGAYLNYRWRK